MTRAGFDFDDEEEDFYPDSRQGRRIARRRGSYRTPPARDPRSFHDDRPMPVGRRRRFGAPPRRFVDEGRHGGLQPETEYEVVGLLREFMRLQNEDTQLRMARDAHFNAEMRANFRCMREEFSAMMGEARRDANDQRMLASQDRQKLYDVMSIKGSFLEHQAEANRQGWSAFTSGMQMMIQAIQEKGNYQHDIHAIQMQHIAERHQVELERERERYALPQAPHQEKSGRRGFVQEVVGPLAGVITAEVMRGRGNEPASNFVLDFMRDYFEMEDEEDEEDEEEEAQVASVPAMPKGRRKAKQKPDPNSDQPPVHLLTMPKGETVETFFKKTPIVAMLRMLQVWLTRNQREQIVAIVGRDTWAAMKTAAEATKDTGAILKLAPLAQKLKADESLQEKIGEILGKSQRELLDDLITKIREKLQG
jgi:hypothetical protein